MPDLDNGNADAIDRCAIGFPPSRLPSRRRRKNQCLEIPGNRGGMHYEE
jgi:hypothetical protein